jgi:hypothetical protein
MSVAVITHILQQEPTQKFHQNAYLRFQEVPPELLQ